ncbi:cobalt-zinc-cadmium efflux system protein [Alteribacillus persepolensis]|uniref:Cobalt-zinc-cadmium efflux system protein n=1 Tax=Alteribacillus persepolensis TaxID=568899 RepID=A0A1G8EBU4_9BACI|nr:cation diffusion facilitator family transporter [Alteribacillus persepolensis]SDH67358.1 cobalt-zinc-cadmium efflux system protein [Alteribacillus persepolensis]
MNYYDYHHLNHVKTQRQSKKTLWITLCLTLFFTIVEIVGGLLSNSLALLSDSAHMISDVFALGLSMTAIYMASRKPNEKYTFGFLRFEIIASFINGLALAVIAVGIFIEGIRRMIYPESINLSLMLTIAVIGLIVNIVLTYVLSRSTKHEENLNIKSALWHFIGDLLSSLGIIVAAILIYFTGLAVLDPIISMVIGGIIFTGGARIIRESYLILMESVPQKFDLDEIREEIRKVDGVEDVHEMHLWTVTTDHYSLTAHVFIQKDTPPLRTISAINKVLKETYNLEHNTIQVEHPDINDHGKYGEQFLLNQT